MNNHIILWQKWENPYEIPSDSGDLLENIKDKEFDTDYEWDYNQYEEESAETEEQSTQIFKVNTKAIMTPMGMIPLNERTACTKTFKFWIGHTNFTLSETCKNAIERTDGVEILDIFTRYRFRIAIGKAFQDRTVMQNIQNNLYEKLL